MRAGWSWSLDWSGDIEKTKPTYFWGWISRVSIWSLCHFEIS